MRFGPSEEACDHDRQGRFCSKCGREIDPPRMTFKALMAELSAVWLQKGFRQTAIGLLVAPGRQVRRYLFKDRLLLVRPVSYLIVAAAFHLWVLSLQGMDRGHFDDAALGFTGQAPKDKVVLAAIGWLYDHFYHFALLQAAVAALLLRFVFYRRSGLTLPEYTILMTYGLAESLLIQGIIGLALLPSQIPLPGSVRLLIGLVYNGWVIADMHGARRVTGLLKAFAAYLAAIGLIFVLLIGAVFALETEGPAVMNEVQSIEGTLPKSAP